MRKIFLCIVTCLMACGLLDRATAGCNAANANNGTLEIRANGQLLSANQLVYITSTPTMPTLTAKLTGSPSGTLIWTLSQEFIRGNRNDTTPEYPETLSASQTWNINGAIGGDFFGGKITIQLEGGNGETCSFTFHIRGTNPSQSDIQGYAGSSPWYIIPQIKTESSMRQFDNEGTASATDLKKDCPLKSDDNGWGLMQLTASPVTIDHLWSWKGNIDEGKRRMEEMEEAANFWMNAPLGSSSKPEGGQRVQARVANSGVDVPVPDEPSGNVTFMDGTDKTIEDAVALKMYNGASGGNYCSWIDDESKPEGGSWNFNRYNNLGKNYVQAVCSRVE